MGERRFRGEGTPKQNAKKPIVKRQKGIVEKAREFILQLLFPGRCPVCDGIVRPFGEKICLTCWKKLKIITPPYCMKCGKKLGTEGEYCMDCRRGGHPFVRGRLLYEYESAALSIYRFKYGGRREYGAFYGEQMAELLGDFLKRIAPDGLIPIPLHGKRLAARGYNQAQVLAKALGKELGIPVYTHFLVRVKNTAPLKYENPVERQNNLKNAFIIQQNDVKLERVVIVDDIYTTGSTMDAATRALKAYGVREVYFVALAGGSGL